MIIHLEIKAIILSVIAMCDRNNSSGAPHKLCVVASRGERTDEKLHPLLGWSFWAWRTGHGAWGRSYQCPMRRGGFPSPPTLGMEFPAAFNEQLQQLILNAQ
ncbi:MAG: hypothetical protein V7L23_16190 [Nostoc sp.]|uniref:hypothetical protein n=1 Tax=Nostoc sp. TaxID=1180 RepID=UPI002FF22D57